jgi:Uma2 family endonuclease
MTTIMRLSLEDFLAMPGIDEQRLELIDGEVYEKVSPRWGHGHLVIQLGHLLLPFGVASAEPRAIIPGGQDYSDSAPIPDLSFYGDNPPAPDDWMRRPPDVAVEVLSPGQGRRDMRAKVDLYLRFGVGSVWVFDLQRESVDIYEGGSRRTLGNADTLTTPVVPGLAIDLGTLFDKVAGR